MKIYKIPIGEKFRPLQQNYVWPPQNQLPDCDYGVEQDFEHWLDNHPDLLTYAPSEADYAYVPIYWNRYYINNPDEHGHWGGGIAELSEEFERCKINKLPSFTISEADIKWLIPQINWDELVIFCASRRDKNGGIDIPLLSATRPLPVDIIGKRWLASFLGNLSTDGMRKDMQIELEKRFDCRIENAGASMDEFTRTILGSYIALAPRGQGAQSFRMYEAMQLGTVPLYISDLDCRPFKTWIDWDICSLFVPHPQGLSDYLDVMMTNKSALITMGENAQYTYNNFLSYEKWCKFVIKELELL